MGVGDTINSFLLKFRLLELIGRVTRGLLFKSYAIHSGGQEKQLRCGIQILMEASVIWGWAMQTIFGADNENALMTLTAKELLDLSR